MIEYHDKEWGVPVRDDRKLFEFLTLEGAQAGLSWAAILSRRDGYRNAFQNFEPAKVAKYKQRDVKRLLRNTSIIRNRAKILSTINNARRFLEVQREFGTFNRFVWALVNNKVIVNKRAGGRLPSSTPVSEQLSKELKRRGFSFVGPTVCYAFMQAVGMVNDHAVNCFRH